LDTCDPTQRSAIANELRLVKDIAATGMAAKSQQCTNTSWDLWAEFCQDLWCDPFRDITDPIPLLQIFAHRYRTGLVAPSGAAVRARTVEVALHAVGQTFASLGCLDPRLQASGKLDLRLSRLLSAYKKQDPPPARVKPVPLPIITHAADLCYLANTPPCNAIADMLLLGFYFLLHPGEYAYTDNPDASPFRFCDVHLLIHNRQVQYHQATAQELAQINYVALEFTTQKNSVRGELVGQGLSEHPIYCLVKALLCHVTHLKT